MGFQADIKIAQLGVYLQEAPSVASLRGIEAWLSKLRLFDGQLLRVKIPDYGPRTSYTYYTIHGLLAHQRMPHTDEVRLALDRALECNTRISVRAAAFQLDKQGFPYVDLLLQSRDA